MTVRVWCEPPSTSSLRAQRSNPESFRGGTLDCFAALAMTEQGATASITNLHFSRRHAFASSRRIPPELCSLLHTPQKRGRREGRVPAGTHGPLCANSAKGLHSGIQVKPNTRPSLRDGWTAYAVLSREPSSFWPPSPRELDDAVCPVGLARTSATGLTAATTARTTRFCRTRSASSVYTRPRTHRDYPPCPHLSCRRCRVHRNPARVSNDSRTAPLP
jgi:hypothetical protein